MTILSSASAYGVAASSANSSLTADISAPIDAALALGDHFWVGIAAGREGADAAESTATAYTMSVGQSFYGTLSNSTDGDWVAIQLVAGQSYDIRLLGQGQNFLTDPRVYIYDSTGVQLAEDDDNFTSGSNTHERDSREIFTATYTGTYYVEADAYSTETGNYLLSVTDYNNQGMVFTADEIAWQLTNNGEAFFGSAEAAHFNIAPGGTLTVNITQLTAAGQYLARQALLAWTNVTGIIFQEVSGAAAMTFDDSDADANAYANTDITPGTATITSSSVMITTGWLSTFGTTLNSYSFETYIHEIGHALGLGHGGNYNGSASYGIDNFYLNDSLAWSIMSYMQAENDEFATGGDWNTFTDASFRYLVTPQIADIIAIQNLYGTYSGAFTGNTTYGFNGNTGVSAIDTAVNSGALMAMTIYDNGGTDTLNFANTTQAQVLSLLSESLSSVLGGRHNLGIARGVVIENAIGGSGNDSITGNAVANALTGNNGNDTLVGNEGNDTLFGGGGNDVLNGGAGIDTALFSGAVNTTVSLATTAVQATGHGNDRLIGIENVTSGAGNDTLTGNTAANFLSSGAGNDQLIGDAGNDTLDGGDGADTLNGGDGNDSILGGATAADLRDVVYGGTGDDWIDGGYGNDSLRGDDGNDTIEGGFGADTVVGGAGNDVLTGSAWSDLIFGNDGDDFINGGFGNDRVNGGAGADRFFHIGAAGHGSDWIQDYSGTDNDVLVFGNAAATREQFQINWATTPGAGSDATQEAFVVYRPTGQIMWALVDGGANDHIWLQIGANTYDLMV